MKFGVAVISVCLLSVSPVIKELICFFLFLRDYVLDIFKMTTVATEVMCTRVRF